MTKMLTAKELQDIFKCGHNKVYEIIGIKGFPAVKIGKQYYISEDDLKKWIEKNKGNEIEL